MKKNFYDVNDAGRFFLWAVIAPQLISTVAYLIIILFSKVTGLFYDEAMGILADIYILSMLTQISFAFVYIFLNKKTNFVKASKINKISIRNILICILIGVVGVFALNPISNCFSALFSLMGFNIGGALPFEQGGAFTLITAIILFALVPAILEELVFRGAILQGLRKFGDKKAILISALLFALIHGNLHQFAYTFLFALMLGFVVIKTGSVLSSMIIHFLANAITIIFNNYNVLNITFEMNVWYVLISIVLLAGFFIGVYFLGKLMKNEDKSLNQEELLNELNSVNTFETDEKLTKEEKLAMLLKEMQQANSSQNEGKNIEAEKMDLSVKPNNNSYFLKCGIIISLVILFLNTLLSSLTI